ncbi:hypothetical protein AB1Y20_001592 [Prymnesium parvum]|uniref:Uncharacterized protein n=1 Tax=Prymnesium parvum TaxID=97485 RepID=A0AB34KBT2_PRYPA
MEGGCKWRCKSVAVPSGGSFAFPFESPEGGCLLKYAFHVHDGSSVAFAVAHGGVESHAASGSSCEGVARITSRGMGAIRWSAASSIFSFGVTITYEVILVPLAHLALLERRQMLHYAAKGEAALTLQLMSRLGMEATDDDGRTVLHSAAAAGQLRLLDALLERVEAGSVCLEIRASDGRTALLDACSRCQLGAVLRLLAAGASALPLDSRGRSVLHCLCEGSAHETEAHVEACAALLARVRSEGPALLPGLLAGVDASGLSPLACAAAAGFSRCCQLLLDAGAPVAEVEGPFQRQVSPAGPQPLAAAAAAGSVPILRLLLARGASPLKGAVHAAARAGHTDCLRLLLEHAAALLPAQLESGLWKTDSSGRGALACAAAAGHGACVRLLVEFGAPLEQRDPQGNTALLLACATGEPIGVQSLLDAKASPRWRNAEGRDALCCAAVGGHKPLLPLLLPLCHDRLPDATVQAAAAGHARVTLALAELCPFSLPPPPPPQEASASMQLLAAVWRRCYEEALLLTQQPSDASPVGAVHHETISHPPPRDASAESAPPAPSLTAAAAAAALAAHLEGAESPRQEIATEHGAQQAQQASNALNGAEYAQGTSVAPLALEDLSSIQAMIRMELQAGDDDLDDLGADDEID